MLIGIVLVMLIIIAFLFEWRTAFISLIAIPLSLVAALLVLDLRGTTVNVMVLAGLVVAIGVVVDDAIIDVENIVRRLRQARARRAVPSRRSAIVLDASVEVRSAITYATVINVVAIVPVFFLEGLSGLVLRAAGAVLRARGAGLDGGGADPDAGAVPAHALPRTCSRSRESPLLRGLKRVYARRPRPRLRRPSPAMIAGAGARARRRAHLPHAGHVAAPELQGTRLPHALAHPAGHLRRRGDADLDRGLPGPARDPRRPQLRLAHRAGVPGRRGLRSGLRRELDQRRPERRLRQDPRTIHQTVEGYPGPVPRRPDLSAGTHQGGADRHAASRSWCASTAPTSTSCATKARRSRGAIARLDGVVDAHAALLDEPAAHRGRARPRGRARAIGLKPGDIRRQSSTLIAERGGQRPLPRRPGLRRPRDGASPRPGTASTTSSACRSTRPTAAGHASRTSPRSRSAPTPNAIERQQQSRRIDVGANVAEEYDLGSVVETSRSGSTSRVAARVPRGGAGRVHRAQRGPAAAAGLRDARPGRDLPAPARRLRQPSARGLTFLRCRWRSSAASWPCGWATASSRSDRSSGS